MSGRAFAAGSECAFETWIGERKRSSRPRGLKLTVDPVEVAQTLDVDAVISASSGFPWGEALRGWLRPVSASDIRSWCRWSGRLCSQRSRSNPEYLQSALSLCGSGKRHTRLFETASASAAQGWAVYFEVPKSDGRARIVQDCRAVNKLFADAPSVNFISPAVLVRLLLVFGRPVFAHSDFRHWFHEIRLPECMRGFFSMRFGSSVFRPRSWPMGFKYSPWIAQACGWAVIAAAIASSKGFSCCFPREENVSAETLPSYLVVNNLAGRPVAFFVLWLDNVLIIACNSAVRDSLARALRSSAANMGAMLKYGVTCVDDSVVFCGIEWSARDRVVLWRHCTQNKERWQQLEAELRQWRDQGSATRRQLAEILGVLVWDWYISGVCRAELTTAFRIGAKYDKQSWDCKSSLSSPDAETLIAELKRVQSRPFSRRTDLVMQATSRIFLVSDASSKKGAALQLEKDGTIVGDIWSHKWNERDRLAHISKKETWAAIAGLRRNMSEDHHVVYVMGMDNGTAVKALRTFFFPTSWDITLLLVETLDMLRQRDSATWTMHIPGEGLCADEPSRGKPFDSVKAIQNASLLNDRFEEMSNACFALYKHTFSRECKRVSIRTHLSSGAKDPCSASDLDLL
jgi:hypothetical protein